MYRFGVYMKESCIYCGDEKEVCLNRIKRLFSHDEVKFKAAMQRHGHEEIITPVPVEIKPEPPKEIIDLIESKPIRMSPKKKRNKNFPYHLQIRISKLQKDKLQEEAKWGYLAIPDVVRRLIDKHL